MTDQLKASIVRILGTNRTIAGAGFLVFERHVLTCAHVIAQALGIPRNTSETLSGEIQLDFPLVTPAKWLPARAVSWHPVQSGTSTAAEGGEDISVLELHGNPPDGSQPARLVTVDDLWGHSFRAFGFPAAHDDGVWASGVLRDRQTRGWIQIEDVKQTGYFVEPGFSGTPVWDEQMDGIVGMVVAAEKAPNVRAAFIIPSTTLVKAWPRLILLRPNHAVIDKVELRRRMLKAFDRERLEILCADINAHLEGEGSDLRVSLEIVGGRGLETIILNLIEYLDRRGFLTYLLDAVRTTQPGLI